MRSVLSRPFGHRFGPFQAPPLYVPVNPSPVSRGASVFFVALDRFFDDGRVQTANVAASASTVSANVIDDFILMVRAKRPYISD